MKTFSRVLFPTDFSKSSKDAADVVVSLCRTFGAELWVLHVVELSTFVMYGSDTFWSGENSDALQGVAQKELDEFVKGLEASIPVKARLEMSMEAVPDVICAYVRQNSIDLVVMPTHGRKGIDRLLLGSVTERVVRTCPSPVLTLRTGGTTK